MSYRPLLALLAGLMLAFGRQEAVNVLVETTDGSRALGVAKLGKISVSTDLGDVQLDPLKIQSITFGDPDVVVTATSTLRGRVDLGELAITTDNGELKVVRAKLKAITFKGAAKQGGVPAAGGPPVTDGVLKPAAVLRMTSTVGELILSHDRAALFVLNSTEGKIQKVDIAKRTWNGQVEVADGTEAACLSPDGRTLYAISSVSGHQYSSSTAKPPAGKIQVLDAVALRVKETISIDYDPCDIDCDDGRLYLAPGSDLRTPVAVLDLSKKAITATWGEVGWRGTIRRHPDGKRLYHSAGQITAIAPPADAKSAPASWNAPPFVNAGGPFVISPDGQYVVCGTGVVLKIGKGPTDDLRPAAKVDEHLASAMDAGVLFIATKEGVVKRYSTPDYVFRQSWSIGEVVYRLAFDKATRSLFAATDMKKAASLSALTGVGDVAILAVPEWTDPADLKPAEPAADGGIGADGWKPKVKKGVQCPLCNGKKELAVHETDAAKNEIDYAARCFGCGAKGVVDLQQCPACRGEGTVRHTVTVVIGGQPSVLSGEEECERCGAGGWIVLTTLEEAFRSNKPAVECFVCRGTKKFTYTRTVNGAKSKVSEDCRRCKATGKLKISRCATCAGRGYEFKNKTILIQGRAVDVAGTTACSGCSSRGYTADPE